MKTVEEIRVSNSVTKTIDYCQLANELTIKSYELIGSSTFLGRFVSEMETICERMKSRDSEFMLYRDALAVEIWFSKIEGIKSSKLTMKDLI